MNKPKLIVYCAIWESQIYCLRTTSHASNPKKHFFQKLAEARAFAKENGHPGITVKFK